MSNNEIEKELIGLMKSRVNSWKDAVAFVTPKVAFNIRTLIESCRKNYWGIFDSPTDEQTGHDKVWIPLTEAYTESSVKNTDNDMKDIKTKAKNTEALRLNSVFREAVVAELDKIGFDDTLNNKERIKAIDGTAIAKIVEDDDNPIRMVDRLNFFIDPAAESIQKTPLVIERSIMTRSELKEMGWDNISQVSFKKNISANNVDGQQNENPSVEVYELWGLLPNKYHSGQEDDKGETESHAVVIDLFNTPVVGLLETNPKGLKPYEEDWYIKVPGRWDGRGVPERLMMLQVYINTIVNIRITRSRVNQLGLFKAKKGKGITAQSLSRLAVNGVVQVQDMADLEQFVMQDIPQSSYTDENVARDWAERVTHSFEIATGEDLPSTTTATIGAIQNSNAKTFYELVRENSASFVERIIERHLFKDIIAKIKKNKEYQLEFENQDLKSIDMAIMSKAAEDGQDIDTISAELDRAGNKRGVIFDKDISADDYGITVYMGNNKVDENVQITNLLNMMKVAPEYREQIIAETFSLLGLNFRPAQQAMLGAGGPMMNPQSQVDVMQNANTLNSPVTV